MPLFGIYLGLRCQITHLGLLNPNTGTTVYYHTDKECYKALARVCGSIYVLVLLDICDST